MRLTLPLFLLATASLLHGDGGSVILNRQTANLVVTVFASPSPPQAGMVDLSVLLQRPESLDPILDAQVEITLTHGSSRVETRARHDEASNKMLYAATVELNQPGDWRYTITIHSGETPALFDGVLAVDPGPGRLDAYSFYLALPFIYLAIYAIHQWLRLSKRL